MLLKDAIKSCKEDIARYIALAKASNEPVMKKAYAKKAEAIDTLVAFVQLKEPWEIPLSRATSEQLNKIMHDVFNP